MLRSLVIENFRCFGRLKMEGLGRINLIVGTNNSGKTALLEAIELWATQGDPGSFRSAMRRRGELYSPPVSMAARTELEYGVRHLFHGHEIGPDQEFSIAGSGDDFRRLLRAVVERRRSREDEESQQRLPLDADEELEVTEGLLFAVYSVDEKQFVNSENEPVPVYRWRLTSNGGAILPRGLLAPMRGRETRSPAWFVTTQSLQPDEAFDLLGEVVLTEEEELLITALQSVESCIERVALAGGGRRHLDGRGGIVVKLKDQKQRVPIGSMGDGIWRILSLALALVNVRGGILLVDEIDTGLHFSVMADMWKMIIETARRLDVQVFATTHSRDCWESLAVILQELDAEPHTAAIHRIERDQQGTVVFDEQKIRIAAERHIEVR